MRRIGIVLLVLAIVAVCSLVEFVPLAMHKHAMEHITGHPVSWWDAWWTK